ncbi:MAG: hypothetical protein R3A80_10050 [Bdellovibrionota bacterium]
MMIGKILWWDSKDNNGLIKTPDGSKFYFDKSVIGNIKSDRLKAGAYVTFEQNLKIKNCLCAMNVKLTPAKSIKQVTKKFEQAQQLNLLEVSGAA